MCLTLGVLYYIIILYIIYYYTYTIIILLYYYILYYTLPSSSLSPPPILPIFLYSSSSSFRSSSQSIYFLSPLIPSPLPFLFPPLQSFPPLLPIFILYVSVLTYTYLYSINISPIFIFPLLFYSQPSNNSDPACFIGVDG